MTRPRATPPDPLLLFVTELQQLDAVHEYGTETIGPSTIDLDDRIPGLFDDDHDDDCDCADCESAYALTLDADRYEEV